jgi:DNA polymerase-3 subunit gamma/tau
MSYEVVARRWRPSTFADVIGQDHVTATLANALERDRVAHAFVFAGIRGVGKTTVARLIARALNCLDRKGPEPCNQCASCADALKGASIDILEIDGASHTGVDDARALIENSQYQPSGGKYRVYIIDEVHRLSAQAFDALLKLLEEPPAHVKFVLATTEAHKLPQTILSRCQRYDFRRLTREEITKQLAAIVKKDKLKVAKPALELLAREADGSMRDGQSLLEQVVAACGDLVEQDDVSRVLGIAGSELVAECVDAVLSSDTARIVDVCERVRSGGFGAERYLGAVLEMLRHTAVAVAAGPKAVAKVHGDSVAAIVSEFKDKRSQLDLQRIFDVLLRTAADIRPSGMPELVLEMGLIKAASLESVDSAAEIISLLRGGVGSGPANAPERSAAPASRERAPRAAVRPAAAQSNPSAQRESRSEAATPPEIVPEAPHPGGVGAVAVAGGDDSGEDWENFLGEVRKHCGFDLYVALSNCDVTRMDDSVLELRVTIGSFKKKLETTGAMSRVLEVANSFFGRAIDIRFTDGAAPAAPVATDSDATRSVAPDDEESISVRKLEAGRRAKLEQDATDDPSVKAALDVLGGRIDRISQVED